MSNLKDKALEYLSYSLSVLFTKEDKNPALSTWEDLQKKALTVDEVNTLFNNGVIRKEIEIERAKKDNTTFIAKGMKMFAPPMGLAIICGAVSGNLEVIDVDTKHDTTGTLWDELRVLLEDNLPDLYSSLVIAQTRSGGYHIYYRCSSIEENQKLATKLNKEVLIETRGEGGYVIAPPTPNYTYIQGNPSNIPTISPQDREIIFSISKRFTEIPEEDIKVNTPIIYPEATGLSPWEDYNQRGDIVALLKAHGWTETKSTRDRIYMLRPGETDSKSSGDYHIEKRVFKVFTTSTEFEAEKGYSPSTVYTILECKGDTKEAYKKLLKEGYGEPYVKDKNTSSQQKTELIKVEAVNPVNRVTSVISTPGDYLKSEFLEVYKKENIVITSPGLEAQEEVLKAITLIEETGKRVYILEGGSEMRAYRYRLRAVFNKYGAIQEQSGGLTDRETDSLLDEVVNISLSLQPVDKDIFLKDFLSYEAIQELGIKEESIAITIDRLTSTRDKEAQAVKIKKLLSEATALQDKGDAIKHLKEGLKDIDITTGKGLLPPPLSFTTLLDEIATLPPAYKTGYSSLDSFIGFTPGAITLIAGRPSHGKTTFMFNLLLQMSNLYKDEIFYFFSYEEPVKNISVKLLNRLIDTDLSGHFRDIRDLPKPTNYEFIKHYIRARRTDITQVEEGKRLLQEFIDSQRIRVIDKNYSVEQLSSLIAYLNKKERIGALIIDYIQRMRTESKTQDKRTEIAHISAQVLQIAKDSGLPIILGAQLNRATLSSGNKKPALENLKEAGNLEEDANTVISVYNESREKEESSEGETYNGLREVSLEIKTLKNREGEVNQTALLTFDKWTGVIKNSKSSGRYLNF